MKIVLALTALTCASAFASPRDAAIRDVPAMNAARAAHTATTLADGTVLIFGGFAREEDELSDVELYDPQVNRFAPLDTATAPRQSHTATVLPDGRVLIAGGYGARTGCLATAEIFDPSTRTFRSVADMRAPRCEHTAVTLRDGRVALIGGKSANWTFLDSIEIFDATTGSFATAGRMTVPRTSSISVLLPDGRIFIAGGNTGRRATLELYASTEIFDPRSGRSMQTAPMSMPRHKHDAVALADGRVLVTGGASEDGVQRLFDSAEIYDPARNVFAPAARMHEPRYKHRGSTVLLANGKVLIAGGARQAEIYDPVTDTFSLVRGATPLHGRFAAVAVLGDRRVLISGGYFRPAAPSSNAWIYDAGR